MDELEQIVQRMLDAGESEDNIAAVIREYQPQPQGLMGTLQGMGRRLAETPGNIVRGVQSAVTSPLQTVKGLYESQLKQFDKAGEAVELGRYTDAAGFGLAGLLPLIGPAAAGAGEAIGTGEPERIGEGIVDAALTLLPASRSMQRAATAPVRAAARPLNAAALTAARRIEPVGGVTGQAAKLFREFNPARENTRVSIDRYAPNTPASAPARGRSQPSGVSPTVRAASQPMVERYAPNTPGMVSEGVEGAGGLLTAEQQAAQAFDRYAPNTPASVPRTGRAEFNTRTPDVVEAERFMPGEVGGSVAAPGFDLGPMTAMADVPVSARTTVAGADDAARAAQSMERGSGIDWRTTDAVPIDAMRRSGTILEAGESRIGLAEQLAEVLKTGDLGRASELAKAIRQRMHISESGR